MKVLLIFTLFLTSGGGESGRVMGYSGGGVLIKCRYETQYTSNPKYFCKGPWSNCADQIKTGLKNAWINSGRFSLFDDTRAAQFWVVITELTVEDSGTYQCAVDVGFQLDVYTAVKLNVKEDQDYKKSISVTGDVGGRVNISCKYPKSHRIDPKFLCRRVGTADCNYKTSGKQSRRWIKQGKFSLYDDRAKQIFTVSFSSLTEGDSGEYWCGVESDWTADHGYKVYITQINLTVTESPISRNQTSVSEPPAFTPSPVFLVQTSTWPVQSSAVQLVQSNSTGPAIYSSISVGIVLLTIGLVTAFYYKIKPKGGETVMRYSGQVLHSLDTTTNQPDLVYQSLDTTTNQPDLVYQSLDTTTNQSDSVYQSLDNTTDQSNSVYQSVDITNNQSDSVYQSLDPTTDQSDSVYQSLDTTTDQSDSVYQSLNTTTNQSDSVYQSLNPPLTSPTLCLIHVHVTNPSPPLPPSHSSVPLATASSQPILTSTPPDHEEEHHEERRQRRRQQRQRRNLAKRSSSNKLRGN
ncbi:polymeric immunoglobulin receptor-like [Pygocentrus nattereri]|uniref:polymeric immunoglobulin receptor-like n=1 Tax=Pygocentrus nattereri TaxID=42514 RepID=UPI001891CCCF|nr:polymeric immunoglobulin receptor-like [Pygocentrus nattereri]